MDNLLEQLEQWNKNDEFSRCIEAIEAIPEKERGYKLTVLLGRAYSNLAVLGDHKAHGDDDEVDKELIQHSIDILETVWKQGENDPYWNARMGYAHLMADDGFLLPLKGRERAMRFKKWNIGTPAERDVALLRSAGYPYLLSTVLAARGVTTAEAAAEALERDRSLSMSPRCPAGESGELHQASGAAGDHHRLLSRRG